MTNSSNRLGNSCTHLNTATKASQIPSNLNKLWRKDFTELGQKVWMIWVDGIDNGVWLTVRNKINKRRYRDLCGRERNWSVNELREMRMYKGKKSSVSISVSVLCWLQNLPTLRQVRTTPRAPQWRNHTQITVYLTCNKRNIKRQGRLTFRIKERIINFR